ncbi:Transcriptional regulator, LuxR-family [Cupriavidus taiwanensis]|uniref:Transcriptional regulator, LuxR-family n=1 Tax=Cupriavidus taiwanensis TaxID=164546 RepID=A0A375E7R6_9BURK|nr:LuxR C-terminal-related transcriptional regulator [Cupriavidus taiwanensis]SOZ64611.1 Transcriptional regulator, LuxR-family [Cupriavidus taiwanensis]SOZ65520.1 Transcriptional regulator, LuxR-family [Cupriavidus taiwanensis]SOZ69100.1 Transcriptional regulator, LuxR-family [Cupriavidus taiwanensis]SPA08357.1 Transcriptional regulator, LuxR-family [Cupriavidus taiwanensis]
MRVAPEIVLTDAERAELESLAGAPDAGARVVQRARMVLLAAHGMRNQDIAEQLGMGRAQVSRWRERYVQWRLAGITSERPRGAPPLKVDVARLAALTAQGRPDSSVPWSTRQLARELGVSAATISRHWRAIGQEPPVLRQRGMTAMPQPGGRPYELAGLFLSPALHALVLSAGTDAPQPGAPDAPARGRGTSHLLRRLRTLAAHLHAAAPATEHEPQPVQHASAWLAFLRRALDAAPDRDLLVLSDNHAVQQLPAVARWVARQPRLQVHCAASPLAWPRMVQRFFREMDGAQRQHAMHQAAPLLAAIEAGLREPEATAFAWAPDAPAAQAAPARTAEPDADADNPPPADTADSATPPPGYQPRLAPPRVAHALMPRPALMARLHEARRQRCAVVLGPAGSGKTTTMLAWRRALLPLDYDVAWLSLAPEDNEPARFFAGLLAAIAQASPDATGAAAALLGPGYDDAALEHWVIRLVQGLARHPRELVLMLDDLHHLGDARIFQMLQWLLAYAPPNFHLALGSRSVPPVSFERLRARGGLTEIEARDLRFSAEESERFLADQLGAIDRRQAIELHRRADGWVTGLQRLAAELGQRRGHGRQQGPDAPVCAGAFDGAFDRFIAGYFEQEVLARLAPDDLDLLTRAAVCHRLCAPLCAALAGHAPAAAQIARRLARLERDNLFLTRIAAGERDIWYRLHPMLRDVLLARVEAWPAPARQALHAAAFAWFEANGLTDDAVRHAVLAGNADAAAGMVEARAYGMLVDGELSQLGRLLRLLPQDSVQQRFSLLLASAYLQMYTSRFDEAAHSVQRILAQHGQLDRRQCYSAALIQAGLALQQDDIDTVLAMVPALRDIPPQADDFSWICRANVLGWAFVYQGEYDQARAIVEHTGVRHAAPRSRLLGQCIGAMSLSLEGRLEQAEQIVRTVLARAEAGGAAYTGLACMAAGLLADMLFELNDTEAAIQLLEPRIHVLERISLPDTVRQAMTVLSGAHWLAGRRDQAWACLDRLEAYAVRFGLDRLRLAALAQRLRRHQQLGEMEAAGAAMQQLEAIAARYVDPGSAKARLVQAEMARVRIEMGLYLRDFGAAAAGLDALLQAPRTARQPARHAALHLQQALARRHLDDLPAARQHVHAALRLGHRLGLVRTLLDACTELPQALGTLAQDAALDPVLAFYASRLQAEAAPAASAGARASAASAAAHQLSEREREVLDLVAQAMPNKKIAMVLGLSAETVKWHLKNIYAKLGVSGRGGAAARLRDLAD